MVIIADLVFIYFPFGKLLFLFAVVNLGKTAFAGFPEPVVQVDAGFLHGPADHIIADVTGAGEEIAEIAGVHSPHSGYGVALDTRDLHQSAYRVTSES